MRRILFMAAALVLSSCTTITPAPTPCPTVGPSYPYPPYGPVVGAQTTKKITGRWLMYKKSELNKPVAKGLRVMSAVPGGKPVDGLNAFAFDKKPVLPANILSASGASDWVIQPEYVHSKLDIVEIKPYKCPVIPDPVMVCPGDPRCPIDPGPTPSCLNTPWNVKRTGACEAAAKVDESQILVCDTDTGVDPRHADFEGRVIGGKSFVAGEAWDNDTVGQHGTHTMGTMISKSYGMAPKALGIAAKILANSGSGNSTQIAGGIYYCADYVHPGTNMRVKIINASWGSSQSDQMINQALAYAASKGIKIFIAAGNDSRPMLNWPAALAPQYPNKMFAITASDQNDQKATFSTYGVGVAFIAPGVNVPSTKPGGGSQLMSGTSMATPAAAGVCALGLAAGKDPCIKGVNVGLAQNIQGGGLAHAPTSILSFEVKTKPKSAPKKKLKPAA